MDSSAYEPVNKAWKSACKVVFGQEVGELKAFEPWLEEYVYPPREEKSALSGKDVNLTSNEYGQGAKFARLEEIDFNKKYEPIALDDITKRLEKNKTLDMDIFTLGAAKKK
jgi:hypothetical protein